MGFKMQVNFSYSWVNFQTCSWVRNLLCGKRVVWETRCVGNVFNCSWVGNVLSGEVLMGEDLLCGESVVFGTCCMGNMVNYWSWVGNVFMGWERVVLEPVHG